MDVVKTLKRTEELLEDAQRNRIDIEKSGKDYRDGPTRRTDTLCERHLENEVARLEYIRDFGSEGRYTR